MKISTVRRKYEAFLPRYELEASYHKWLKKIVEDIDYDLASRGTRDNMGGVHQYKVTPRGSGCINYFDTDTDLVFWVSCVEQTRGWISEVDVIIPQDDN